MVKLIYSSTYDTVADVAMHIVQEKSVLVKSASTIFGCDYSALAPDSDHVGLHVTALGAYERYWLYPGAANLAAFRDHLADGETGRR